MQHSADSDQTALKGAVWSGSSLFAIPLNNLTNNYIKGKIQPKKYRVKEYKILGHLPYTQHMLSWTNKKTMKFFLFWKRNVFYSATDLPVTESGS